MKILGFNTPSKMIQIGMNLKNIICIGTVCGKLQNTYIKLKMIYIHEKIFL